MRKMIVVSDKNCKQGKKPLELLAKKVSDLLNIEEEISVVLVDGKYMKKINGQYRDKNIATDVLAFEDLDEIFICPQVVEKNAKENSITFNEELTRVFIHGIFHLKGYDHELVDKEAEEMKRVENNLLKNL